MQIEAAVRMEANKLFQMIGAAHGILSNSATRAQLELDLMPAKPYGFRLLPHPP